MTDDCLDKRTRAEDILLGSIGLDEDAHIVSVSRTADGYQGIAVWSDGEKFNFESNGGLTPLEEWALNIFLAGK